MPELPEVETVVQNLKPSIVGKKIDAVIPQNNYDKVLATHKPNEFNKFTVGEKITDVARRGKYIVIHLTSGYILIHLRMTGRLLLELSENDKHKHLTAIIQFQDGTHLYFKDYRKFGRLYYYDTLDFINKKLGIEPLSEAFTREWFMNNKTANDN